MDSLETTTCAKGFRQGHDPFTLIRYRVIKGEYDILLIVEGGYLGTITMSDELEEGDGRSTIIEWYDSPVTTEVLVQLKTAIEGGLHELPPIMYNTCDTVRGIVEQRLQGFEPENDFGGLVFDYLCEESMAYYDDNTRIFDDPKNLDGLFTKITGSLRKYAGVEDEELLKDFF